LLTTDGRVHPPSISDLRSEIALHLPRTPGLFWKRFEQDNIRLYPTQYLAITSSGATPLCFDFDMVLWASLTLRLSLGLFFLVVESFT